MAIAEYYRRSAVAIAQVLSGFDETAIRQKLETSVLAIVLSPEAGTSEEGLSAIDLTVRLAARLYPTIRIQAPPKVRGAVEALARRINPAIEFTTDSKTTHAIVIGKEKVAAPAEAVYVGSDEWTALVSRRRPQPVGKSRNPFGAGAAACLGMAAVFRAVFSAEGADDGDLRLRTLPKQLGGTSGLTTPGKEVVLVGVGAIGQATVWALSRLADPPRVRLVDPEAIDLGNLQRYVLAERVDVGRSKIRVAKRALRGAVTFKGDWSSFVEKHGYAHSVVLTALDSAHDRRAVQAAVPQLVLNAWTQPGDLGVSSHDFIHGACLACLYLPVGPTKNEDVVYAEALGVPDQLGVVRTLLHNGEAIADPLLYLIADRLQVPRDFVKPFSGRPIRELYTEGICGGAVLPIGQAGSPRAEVHVPLAHQSGLAGVLLAARLYSTIKARTTLITRVDLMRSINTRYITQARSKDSRGICICQDADFIEAYRTKYSAEPLRGAQSD